ncbi:MAG: decarboxylating NADP(+)-dependent phosphogluconate dehydrogenase [Saprospiraceae bacterium]
MQTKFGIIGLGVMGKSLARNMASKGIQLSLYNRFEKGVEEQVAQRFIADFPELSSAKGFEDLADFVQSLERPRKMLLMVKAGAVIDSILEKILPNLSEGDIIIDGGNSHYHDTEKRIKYLAEKNIHFIGCGVSGGEEGALKGPSIMPGGSKEAYQFIAPYLEKIAAKDKYDTPCCTFIGTGGSGHFVKMVHNGIEYAEMQLLAELYFILRHGKNKTPNEIADIFSSWQGTHLDGYLLEITVHILRKKENGDWLIDKILDQAGNKGTGSWTTIAAAELGVPITMITAALFARYISAFKKERVQADQLFQLNHFNKNIDLNIEQLKNAYYLARITNHHQGIHLISTAAETYKWDLHFPEIARIWTNGCIIRSVLMEELMTILQKTDRLIIHPYFIDFIKKHREDLSTTVGQSVAAGLDIPCFSAAINFINGYTNALSSANIIQAQRDYFGAHTYKRNDDPLLKSVHTDWSS